MKVYKFGGASIADSSRMKNLLPLVCECRGGLLIVMSALGKTTNALETIVNEACYNKENALLLADILLKQHLKYANEILDNEHFSIAKGFLALQYANLEEEINMTSNEKFDRGYDQIVCMGELFSSYIFSCLLKQNNIDNEWVDAREVITTDDTYRDAVVDWDTTKMLCDIIIGNHIKLNRIVITQGFIGATPDGSSVTLGREGSDYTAALLASIIKAESVTIWKDVNGLQNADPKQFPNTVKIDAISYREVIEMAYYGAQIIHPKTIKPLQNFHIPLYIKSFLSPDLVGTVIKNEVLQQSYPPLIILKENQVLLHVTAKDYSFISEHNLSKLYSIFHDLKIKVNIIQNAAISFITCIDNRTDKIEKLIEKLKYEYFVVLNENVSLLTVRHPSPEVIFKLIEGKTLLLKQETRATIQIVTKESFTFVNAQ